MGELYNGSMGKLYNYTMGELFNLMWTITPLYH